MNIVTFIQGENSPCIIISRYLPFLNPTGMKLGSIQLLRGIAAILIVYAFSISFTMGLGKFKDFYFLSQIGYIGQDIFFVITGFLIAYVSTQYHGVEEGIVFLQRRFFRVNPLYYIASILCFSCQAAHSLYTSNALPRPTGWVWTGIADTILVVPTGDELSEYMPLLQAGWALAFDWLFYVLFFITVVTKVKRKLPVLIGFIVLLAAAGYFIKPTDLRLSFVMNPILGEFLLGIVAYQLYRRLHRVHAAIPAGLALAGIGWYIFLVFYGSGYISNPHYILGGTESLQRLGRWGLPAGGIVFGCIMLEKQGKLPRLWNHSLGRRIGDASYSITLVGMAVLGLFGLLYAKTGLKLPPNIAILVQMVVAVIVGMGFYRWVERPLVRWLNKFAKKTPPIVTQPMQPQST